MKRFLEQPWFVVTLMLIVALGLAAVLIAIRTATGVLLGEAIASILQDYGEIFGAILGFLGAYWVSRIERGHTETLQRELQRAIAEQEGARRKASNIYAPIYNELLEAQGKLREYPYPTKLYIGQTTYAHDPTPSVLVRWLNFKPDVKLRAASDVVEVLENFEVICKKYGPMYASLEDLVTPIVLDILQRRLGSELPVEVGKMPLGKYLLHYLDGIVGDVMVGGDRLERRVRLLKQAVTDMYKDSGLKDAPDDAVCDQIAHEIIQGVKSYRDGHILSTIEGCFQDMEKSLAAVINLLEDRIRLIREQYEGEPQNV